MSLITLMVTMVVTSMKTLWKPPNQKSSEDTYKKLEKEFKHDKTEKIKAREKENDKNYKNNHELSLPQINNKWQQIWIYYSKCLKH